MNKEREREKKNQSVKSQNITEKKRVTVSRLLLFPVFFRQKTSLLRKFSFFPEF